MSRCMWWPHVRTCSAVWLPTDFGGAFGLGSVSYGGSVQLQKDSSPTQVIGMDSLPDGTAVETKIGDARPDYVFSFSSAARYRRPHRGNEYCRDYRQTQKRMSQD